MRMKEMTLSQKKKVSNVFNVSRCIAILSVITAHTTFDIDNLVLFNLIKRFSSIGVIAFIIISGYYFNPKKYNTIKSFMKSKLSTIVIPWFVIGTLVFLEARIVMGQSIDVLSWLKFLIGHNSYLYYLTVLMICYLIYFYPVKNNKTTIVCVISVVITVLSQQLTAWGLVDTGKIYLTDYLNIFNWVGYFCLGVYLKRINVYNLLTVFKKHIALFIILWLIVFALAYRFDSKTGYFSLFGIPLQIIGAVIVFGICSVDIFDCKVTRYISKISFCVYLVHMAVVSIVYKFLGNLDFIKLLVPLVTLLSITSILFVCEKVSYKLKISGLFYKLSGIRNERKD